MSISVYVVGYMPADEEWQKYKAVWDACKEAVIDPPNEVWDYFDGEYPYDALGKITPLEDCVNDYDNGRGFDLDVSKIPKKIQFVRFYWER